MGTLLLTLIEVLNLSIDCSLILINSKHSDLIVIMYWSCTGGRIVISPLLLFLVVVAAVVECMSGMLFLAAIGSETILLGLGVGLELRSFCRIW